MTRDHSVSAPSWHLAFLGRQNARRVATRGRMASVQSAAATYAGPHRAHTGSSHGIASSWQVIDPALVYEDAVQSPSAAVQRTDDMSAARQITRWPRVASGRGSSTPGSRARMCPRITQRRLPVDGPDRGDHTLRYDRDREQGPSCGRGPVPPRRYIVLSCKNTDASRCASQERILGKMRARLRDEVAASVRYATQHSRVGSGLRVGTSNISNKIAKAHNTALFLPSLHRARRITGFGLDGRFPTTRERSAPASSSADALAVKPTVCSGQREDICMG